MSDTSIGQSGGGEPTLSWTHLGDHVLRYEIWRSDKPYFDLGQTGSENVAIIEEPFSGQMTWTDESVGNNADESYFYVIQMIDIFGRPAAISTGRGYINLSLAPGS